VSPSFLILHISGFFFVVVVVIVVVFETGSHYVAQAGLKLSILLPQPPMLGL
jgi:hypothetical protein